MSYLRQNGCLIMARELKKSFGDLVAVNGIDLEVMEGEIFGLVGPDGAGKTTILRLLCGLMRPSEGRAEVAGIDVHQNSAAVRDSIGYMPQRFGLYLDLSVSENLNFYADLFGLSIKQREPLIERYLRMTRMEPFSNRFAGQLAIRFEADAGGGAPPLPPGDGPIARVHFRTRANATPGDTAAISVMQLGSYNLTATTLSTDFVPVFNGATLTIAEVPCACASHGDVEDNGFFDALDLSFLIDHIFAGGATPPQDALCPHSDRGDLNCDGFDDALDISYMIDLLFAGGALPCDPCACTSYPDDCP